MRISLLEALPQVTVHLSWTICKVPPFFGGQKLDRWQHGSNASLC